VQGAVQGGANAGLGGPRLHNGQNSGVFLHGSCLLHKLSVRQDANRYSPPPQKALSAQRQAVYQAPQNPAKPNAKALN
jgi:hypothetical protein